MRSLSDKVSYVASDEKQPYTRLHHPAAGAAPIPPPPRGRALARIPAKHDAAKRDGARKYIMPGSLAAPSLGEPRERVAAVAPVHR